MIETVPTSPAPQRFTATLRRLAMNYCVDVPAGASRELAGDSPERYVRVEGAANGHPFRTRLTPRGGGAYRLFLDGDVRTAAGIDVGDEVTIEVARADAPPGPPLPGDLREALSALAGGVEAFTALTEAQRTGMLAFVEPCADCVDAGAVRGAGGRRDAEAGSTMSERAGWSMGLAVTGGLVIGTVIFAATGNAAWIGIGLVVGAAFGQALRWSGHGRSDDEPR